MVVAFLFSISCQNSNFINISLYNIEIHNNSWTLKLIFCFHTQSPPIILQFFIYNINKQLLINIRATCDDNRFHL